MSAMTTKLISMNIMQTFKILIDMRVWYYIYKNYRNTPIDNMELLRHIWFFLSPRFIFCNICFPFSTWVTHISLSPLDLWILLSNTTTHRRYRGLQSPSHSSKVSVNCCLWFDVCILFLASLINNAQDIMSCKISPLSASRYWPTRIKDRE